MYGHLPTITQNILDMLRTPILAKTKNQIFLLLLNTCKQQEKISAKKKFRKKNNILELGDHIAYISFT